MKTTLVILVALMCARLSAENFTTIEGKKYERVTISRVEPDGLMVVTDSGIAKIPFVQLPADVQKKYGYNPKAAAEYSAALAKTAADAKAKRESFLKEQQVLQDEQRKMQDELRKKKAEAYAEEVRRQNVRDAARMAALEEANIQPPSETESTGLGFTEKWLLKQPISLSNGKSAVPAIGLVRGMTHDALAFEDIIGKRINVYGRVEALDRDLEGNPYARLEARDVIGAVKCVFTTADVEKLRGILGRNVIVEGTLEGVTLGIVKMSACKFTK